MNATRFAQKPLPQPAYNFCDVPKPARDLKGCSLQKVTNREDLQSCMAEMLLLCKEAIRRRPCKGTGSKPLSLEYLADRMDVDDPLWGYIIRSKEGMMQGFCTVTTFTNYQQTFRWDSEHVAAFDFDDNEMEALRLSGVRKWDKDGELARGLQQTVRAGDVWNEGIVWPRVAELGLLGGLGCGRALLSLVIEDLECMRATGKANYDYIALQATDNSIPFYESVGFLRVGAVMDEDEPKYSSEETADASAVAEAAVGNKSEEPVAMASPNGLVSSAVKSYTTKKKGECLNDIVKQMDVDDVWDVIFLNQRVYADILPTSKLLAGTVLTIPVKETRTKKSENATLAKDRPQWYTAKDDETPRMIAKKFSIDCLALVEANKVRLPGLLSNSKLMDGTPLKVSHLTLEEKTKKPYAHWAFPDDQFEDGEPSYMMALKLNRRRGAKARPFLESLAVDMTDYVPSDMLIPPSMEKHDLPVVQSAKKGKKAHHPDAPIPPKRPLSAYLIFSNQQRSKLKATFAGLNMQESTKIISEKWQKLPGKLKKRYENIAQESRKKYTKEKSDYDEKYAKFCASHPEHVSQQADNTQRQSLTGGPASETDIKYSLFNKVVRLKPGAMTEGSESTYWYVLTYIPDLRWCHLAPMIQVGTFGEDRPKVRGRPKWKLVDESLGKEVDISSSFCIPIMSKSVRRTHDADKEEWDIIDDGSDPCARPTRRSSLKGSSSSSHSDSDYNSGPETAVPIRRSTAIKPSAVERKRKRRISSANKPAKVQHVRIVYTDDGGKICVFEKYLGGNGDAGSSPTLSRLSSLSSTESESDHDRKRRKGRPRKTSSSTSSNSDINRQGHSESNMEKRGRPTKGSTPDARKAASSRPRRKSAPSYLGESPRLSQKKKVTKIPPGFTLSPGTRLRRNSPRSKTPIRNSPGNWTAPRAASSRTPNSPLSKGSNRKVKTEATTPRRSPRHSVLSAQPSRSTSKRPKQASDPFQFVSPNTRKRRKTRR